MVAVATSSTGRRNRAGAAGVRDNRFRYDTGESQMGGVHESTMPSSSAHMPATHHRMSAATSCEMGGCCSWYVGQ
uniref:Uncharacterized protein n=1 Tax=Romanomermis culicivorax TaxID=13658 RepID=A0A915J5Y8_ROMCU